MTGSRFSQWRALAFREKLLLVRFVFCLPWIALCLRFFGYLRTRHFLLHFVRQDRLHQADDIEMRKAQRVGELIAIAGRHGLVTATCLRQSVLLEYWLKRRGLAAEIRIGVRKAEEDFDAHAWVELNGMALAQDNLEHHHLLRHGRDRS